MALSRQNARMTGKIMAIRPPAGPTAAATRYLDMLARAAAYVDAHLDGPLDVDLLASSAAMSRHHFHRIFHAYFGLTVGGYVTWRRLRQACALLANGSESVIDVAVAVGFASAQALAKAMRRELDTTPSEVRAGSTPVWDAFFARREIDAADRAGIGALDMKTELHPRWVDAPAFAALTASGWGMSQGVMMKAARQGFAELWDALEDAGLAGEVTNCIAALPEEPQGPEDPHCRMLTGALFGVSLPERRGTPREPEISLTGSLAWMHWPAGRYAVFTHIGPYDGLHRTWKAIYRQWLPATGYALRDVPGFDLYVDDARSTPPEQLRTDLYLPLQ